MNRIVLTFFSLLTPTSCGQNRNEKKSKFPKDTSNVTEEDVTPDIKKLRQEYILSYSKPIEFESINKGKDDEKLKVLGKYYCLFDNAIVVPGRYNFDDTTKSFTTITLLKTLQ